METKLTFETEFIFLIKDKPELKSLNDLFVKQILLKQISQSNFVKLNSYSSFKQFKRSKITKELVTSTRKILRERFGMFIKTPLVDFDKNLSLIIDFNDVLVDKFLSFHQSTFERQPFYEKLYPALFDILFDMGLDKNFSLADLACGYNPLSYKYFNIKPSSYFACDLSSIEMDLINSFFKKTNINGIAKGFDLLSDDFSSFLETHSFDLVFLFKALDSLENVKKHNSKKLLSRIDFSFLVVSFPLVSIGGKKNISSSKRVWFENFCLKENWNYKTFSISNELFYVVKRDS